jgi:hypothetical protein
VLGNAPVAAAAVETAAPAAVEAIALFFFHASTAPSGLGPPHYRASTITLRHTTLGRTPLDE